MADKSKLLDLTLALHHETGAAYLVSDDGNRDMAVFLPKSQVELVRLGKLTEEAGEKVAAGSFVPKVEVTLPIWLAESKGLV